MTQGGRVECGTHGTGIAAYMCRHLIHGSRQGFHCAFQPRQSWPDAWCDACEAARQRSGGWNDESEGIAGIGLVCNGCYESIRARNQIPLDQSKLDDLFHGSLHRLQALNDSWMATFDLLRDHQYYYDEDLATITFSVRETPVAIAQMQAVGSYSTSSNTWMWSWANESSPESARKLLCAVKDFGDFHGVQELYTGTWASQEDVGWRMTAVTVDLLHGTGGYRCKSEHLWVYFALLRVGAV